MLLAAGSALGLISGLISGGRLQNLIGRRVRWPLVVFAAFAAREVLIHTPLSDSTLWASAIAVTSSAVIALWALWHVRELPGIWLVSAGVTLNLVVMLANGGHMPADPASAYLGPPQLREKGVWAMYVLMGPHTRLNWLGDRLFMPWPISRAFPQAYSIGDLISLAGLTVVLFAATRPVRTTNIRPITTR
jgi:hypothetical protein